ncbi:MAG: HlyD family efflux transporter periplasmic adaptor subunit, partial [Anaerolineales bacterium]|nr:HlyD family efflux transporter periplasmic adaptor subunit [Anaerolineales bacterium]
SVKTGGVVAEVLVDEGDSVEAGQVLVRLEGTEQLQAAVSAAQFELANAQYALDSLYKDTDLLAAQALQAKDDAEQALEDLLNPELQQALALKAIADAKKAVEDADRRFANVNSRADDADIDAQKAQVVLARDVLDKAEEDFEPYENKPEDNLTRANYQAKFAAAQQVYDAAVRKLNALEGTGSEADKAVAEADLAAANAQVSEAEREWERVKEGPNQADVALLEAQINTAARDNEIYVLGPDPDDVAIAEARLENARSQIAAAQAALADLELAAPFAGVVSELHINPSEWVSPGQPVLLIADLAHLQVETTDLGEIDVAQIVVGDIVIVTYDALPDVVAEGTISRIAPKASEGSGVNYTVVIDLHEIPAALRWGMTAFVDVELE